MYYRISCEDFANVKGDYNIISVVNNLIYIKSNRKLDQKFELLQELPVGISDPDIIPFNLDEEREKKVKELEEARLKANEKSVEYKGKKFQATEKDTALLTSTIALYQKTELPQGFVWITEDNTMMPVSIDDLINVGKLIAEQVSTNFVKCRLLKNKVMLECTTKEQLEAIKFNDEE